MSISINWATRVITVPFADLTPKPFFAGVYTYSLNAFRLELKDAEDSAEGMPYPNTHQHNTEVTLAGVTLARTLEIINSYTVTFEDGQYAVELFGANSNVGEVANVNQVSIRTANSAGLISTNAATAAAVWAHLMETGFDATRLMRIIAAAVAGKMSGGPGSPVFRDLSDTEDLVTGTADVDGNRTAATYGG